jgi:membrane protein
VPGAGHRRRRGAVRSPLGDVVTGRESYAPGSPQALDSPQAPETPHGADSPQAPETPHDADSPQAPDSPYDADSPQAPETPHDADRLGRARGVRLLREQFRSRAQRWRSSLGGHTAALLRDIAILDKAMLLSAVSFVAFVPFLIVLAAVSPIEEVHTFSGTLQMAMGLTNEAGGAVAKLFAPANRIAGGTTLVGLLILATTAVAFVGTLQQNYELIWNLPRCPRVQRWWRHPVWLAVFLSFGLLLAVIQVGVEGDADENAAADAAAFVVTALFFFWSEYFLLAGRVPKREVIPGGIATAIGLLGLHGFSKLFFSGMIVDQSRDYGLIGAVFVLMSWLVGACVVLVGGPAVGAVLSRRIFHPRHPHYVYNLHHRRSRRQVRGPAGKPERRVPGHRVATRTWARKVPTAAADDAGTGRAAPDETASRPAR